jgi:cytoplasmic tRNA 2-thiolation protein 2
VFACRECFNAYFVHRFRATFGKVRLFTEGEKVLLPFSGGMNSRVLLGLAEEGLKLSAYKKLRFEPTVVVIDGEHCWLCNKVVAGVYGFRGSSFG